MPDLIDIQTNRETVDAILELMELAGVTPSHPDLITSSDIIQTIVIIRDKLESLTESAAPPKPNQDGTLEGTFGFFNDADADTDGSELFANLSSFLGNPSSAQKEDDTAPYYSNTRLVPVHKRILILSNLGIVTYQLKRVMASRDIEVTIAKDLQETLFEFARRPYSGVVIDLFIPKAENGLDAMARLRKAANEKNKPIDVVMLASPQGDGDDDDKEMDYRPVVMQAGAQAFIVKRSDWYDEVLHFFTHAI